MYFRNVYNRLSTIVLPATTLVIDNGVRCPACGTTGPPGARTCPKCGSGALEGRGNSRPADGSGPGEKQPRPGQELSARPLVPVEYDVPEAPAQKRIMDLEDGIRVVRSEMVEHETYQCLICGSTVASESDKCHVCGTIFVSEHEAHTFSGIPVTRVRPPSEDEPSGTEIRHVPLKADEVKVELPSPRPLSVGQLKEADVLPVMEGTGPKRVVIKKKVVKRTAKKA